MAISDVLGEINQNLGRGKEWFQRQSRTRQVAIVAAVVVVAIAGVLGIIFHKRLVHFLRDVAVWWQDFKWGKVVLWILVFFVGFPPSIGYLALLVLCGMVYGFPWGWPLLASALIMGSFVLFLLFRYILHNQAVYLASHNEKFRAFSEILHENNSLWLLTLIRLCPLPYSLSNGALLAIPELSPVTFLLALTITSPKLLIHLFVGSKLKDLGDDSKLSLTKLVDILSIVITIAAAALTTYVIYSKMKQKLAQYERNGDNYDNMIFGNFDEELNIELHLNDYDADNFVIDEDDIEARRSEQRERHDIEDFEISDDEDIRL